MTGIMAPSDVEFPILVNGSSLCSMQDETLSVHVVFNVDTFTWVQLLHLLPELRLGLPIPDPHLLEQDVRRIEHDVRVAAQRALVSQEPRQLSRLGRHLEALAGLCQGPAEASLGDAVLLEDVPDLAADGVAGLVHRDWAGVLFIQVDGADVEEGLGLGLLAGCLGRSFVVRFLAAGPWLLRRGTAVFLAWSRGIGAVGAVGLALLVVGLGGCNATVLGSILVKARASLGVQDQDVAIAAAEIL
ncbi:hypothetical protein VM1G_11528 [Cytospora mali]|uniref:Uncharacterized protein n=1 Tax=Cytospora mali TaxID=578113 RepID=A0A194VZ33_CYTMA|nr:hypothetical protein VM1G_11528 [Valsa mali]